MQLLSTFPFVALWIFWQPKVLQHHCCCHCSQINITCVDMRGGENCLSMPWVLAVTPCYIDPFKACPPCHCPGFPLSPFATLNHCTACPTCKCPGCPLPPLLHWPIAWPDRMTSKTVLTVFISNPLACSPRLPDANVPTLALMLAPIVLLLLMILLAHPPGL